MIDFRTETFLTLCKEKNYTKTAKILNITQPAVSQHIKYLEAHYGGKLIEITRKQFTLTTRGKKLYEFASTMYADSKKFKHILLNNQSPNETLCFGATLTIGEYIMPDIIIPILKDNPQLSINMLIENTESLLKKLQNGEIDFALIEGFFHKSEYTYKLFSEEDFIAICSPLSPLAKTSVALNDVLNQNLILREDGSGTREIFEQLLLQNNLTTDSFNSTSHIGNMNVIKKLISKNLGISFMYKVAASDELKNGTLSKIDIENFKHTRELNFICLKNSLHKDKYFEWFDKFTNYYIK